MRELEREAADWARQQKAAMFMSRALDVFHSGIAFVDTSQPGFSALHLSTAFTKVNFCPVSLATGAHQRHEEGAPL